MEMEGSDLFSNPGLSSPKPDSPPELGAFSRLLEGLSGRRGSKGNRGPSLLPKGTESPAADSTDAREARRDSGMSLGKSRPAKKERVEEELSRGAAAKRGREVRREESDT
jgi:hypothetical protein